MGSPEVEPGCWGWVEIGGEPHRAVVMRVVAPNLFVLWCTSKLHHPGERVLLEPRTPAGFVLQLTVPSAFYKKDVRLVRRSDFAPALDKAGHPARLPPGTFTDLRALLGLK